MHALYAARGCTWRGNHVDRHRGYKQARTRGSQQRVPQALQLKLLPAARLLLLLLDLRRCRGEPWPAEGAAARGPGRVAGDGKARQHVQRGQAVHQPPELAVAGQEAVDEVLRVVRWQ